MFANAFGNHEKVECGLVCFPKRQPDDYSPPVPIPIPLESVSILASVVHAVAQVELTQVFVNKEEQPIEAIYFFPVDSNGGVTHFHAELEGRTIKGIVKPQEEAKAQYDKAVSEKQTAFLVDSNKPDIFKVRIGFLKPGAQVKVVIGYVTEVKNEKGSNAQRFFIPTTVAPRYVPSGDTDEKAIDLRTMKFSETSPAPLVITVNVSLQGGIKALESPTHQVTVTDKALIPEKPNWTRAVVSLTGKSTDMDRDFVLLITPDEVHAPRLYAEEFEKSTALMTHLIPSFSLEDQKVELIFILDRSGSMMGQSIDLAKKALTLFLHSAPVECYFNIVGFGSSFEFLFPESVKYEDGSLKKAVSHAQSLQANLGGTELLQPLKELFNKPLVPGYLRQIFVLTDGEISNTEAVLGLTKANAHLGRLFSLGIGDGCSHHLVEGLAESGGGTSGFVTYNESIDAKVLQQLKNAIQPSLSEVRIEWIGVPEAESDLLPSKVPKINTAMTLLGHGKPIQAPADSETKKAFNQVPEKVPPIYDGTQLLVFGLFESSLPTGVRITAESPDGPLSIEVKLDPLNNLGSTGMLHKLASIKLVRELEMRINGLSSGYSGNNVDPSAEGLKKEIVAISCKHGISSNYTSFVAIDLDDNKTTTENWVMQTRHVPSQYAHGWHGGSAFLDVAMAYCRPNMFSFRSQMTPYSISAGPQFQSRTKCASIGGSNLPMTGGLFGSAQPVMPKFRKMRSVAMSETVCDSQGLEHMEDGRLVVVASMDSTNVIATSEEHLDSLVATQSFNGSFPLNEAFAKSIGQTLDVLQKEAKQHLADEAAFATAIALAYLTHKLKELQDSWELVERKARKWLVKNFPGNYSAILTVAEKFVLSIV